MPTDCTGIGNSRLDVQSLVVSEGSNIDTNEKLQSYPEMAKNLDQLVGDKKISPAGADWLRVALDPFHDFGRDLEGYPDVVSGRSKVQMRTSTVQLTAPGANNYDARIWVNSDLHTANSTVMSVNASATGIIDIDTATTNGSFSFLNLDTYDSGVDPNAASIGATYARSTLKSSSASDAGRLIAYGIEVHNTTAAINASGTCTVSKVPRSEQEANAIVYDSTAATGYTSQHVQARMLPPSSSSTAIAMPGSVQWHARKGCYVMGRIEKPNLNVVSGVTKPVFYYPVQASNVTWANSQVLHVGSTYLYPNGLTADHSFERPVVYFEGLDADSTLTVTLRTYIEYFPTSASSLVAFATPSPAYDMRALQLYTEVAPKLPIAVPVDMNAKGDYFRMVMAAMATAMKVFGPVSAQIHPAGPMVAQLAAMVAQKLAGQNQQKKNQQPAQGSGRRNKKKNVGYGTLSGTPVSR